MMHNRALAVSLHEFSQVLSGMLCLGRRENHIQRIALAISGGVDSMALAGLSYALQRIHPEEYDFLALVVDHRSRKHSTSEAQQTCSSLRGIGLNTELLSLHWDHDSPGALPNFESQARKRRYAVLRDECTRLGIRSLLTAHHLGDQTETILMRITQGYTGYGLRGMSTVSAVPEPSQIYYHSAEATSLEAKYLRSNIQQKFRPTDMLFSGIIDSDIHIGRPLLTFSKERLISTCLESKLTWIEDTTNSDKTLTRRNAVRYLLQKHSLPKALKRESVLHLGWSMSNKKRNIQDIVRCAFDRIKVFMLDPRTGVLEFVPPTRIDEPQNRLESPTCPLAERQPRAAVELAKKIASVVSPRPDLQTERLLDVAELMFPEYMIPSKVSCRGLKRPTGPITAGGVLWEPPRINATDSTWRISRENPNALDSQMNRSWHLESSQTSCWLPWKQFDSRWWIRIRLNSDIGSKSIIVRHFTRSDLSIFRSSLSRERRSTLDRLLKKTAPGTIRWTLPVLVDDNDSPFALPTLGFPITHEQRLLNWQFAYKNIQLPRNITTSAATGA